MKKILLGAIVLLSACGLDKADAFRKGVPSSDSVALKVPGQSTALTASGTRRDGLEGEVADLYRLTRGVTVTVNGATAAVLNLVEQITQYPPSAVTADSATWGPHTDALSPNTWKLTVTRSATDADRYTYALEGKGKTEADSAYRVILSGTHHDAGSNLGEGTFTIDFDTARQLPEHGADVGVATITYAHSTYAGPTEIAADFTGVRDGAQTIDAQYQYVETPGQGGQLDFDVQKDFVAGPGIETGTVRSRWEQSGRGRSDVKASGGDTTADFTLSECWDANFLSTYLEASWAGAPSWGASTTCAFATASFATL